MKLTEIAGNGDKIIDLDKERTNRIHIPQLDNAIASATQWPDPLPWPDVDNSQTNIQTGYYFTVWVESTQQIVDAPYGPFKTVTEAIRRIKKFLVGELSRNEVQELSHEGTFEPSDIVLRGSEREASIIFLDEMIFVITKDFIPVLEEIFHYPPSRAGSPPKKVIELQQLIAKNEYEFKKNPTEFTKEKIEQLKAELETHKVNL